MIRCELRLSTNVVYVPKICESSRQLVNWNKTLQVVQISAYGRSEKKCLSREKGYLKFVALGAVRASLARVPLLTGSSHASNRKPYGEWYSLPRKTQYQWEQAENKHTSSSNSRSNAFRFFDKLPLSTSRFYSFLLQ